MMVPRALALLRSICQVETVETEVTEEKAAKAATGHRPEKMVEMEAVATEEMVAMVGN